MFELHDRLQADTILAGHFTLSLLLIHKNTTYPWCILVPKREKIREIHHLASADQKQLIVESCHLAEVMTSLFAPTTMNVAALGNQVPQLHLHHVARFEGDPAWPGSIWGSDLTYQENPGVLMERVNRLRSSLVGEEFRSLDDLTAIESSAGFTP